IVERKAAPTIERAMVAFLEWSKVEHAEHPNTYTRYRASSKSLLRFFQFKGKNVDAITAKMIEDYKTHRGSQKSKRTKKSITPATINRELACLKSMYFNVQKEHKHIANPVSEVKLLNEANEQDRILTYQEERIYLAVASKTLRDIATLMLETGM